MSRCARAYHSAVTTRIAVVGDRHVGAEPQDAIEPALGHAAAALGTPAPEVRWFETDGYCPEDLVGSHGVWAAPSSPFRSLEGALAGIAWARERGIPLLGTCAGFQHGVIEFARNVLGVAGAQHAEYDSSSGDLFIDEFVCSLAGQVMAIRLEDDRVRDIYGEKEASERYYCRFGLNPRYRSALEDAGLQPAGVDVTDGDIRIMRLVDHPFFFLTLFVPQVRSQPHAPHPLIRSFLAASSR